MYPEGSDYLVGYIREHKLGEYLNLIKESKKVCKDRKSTRLNSSHIQKSRMPSSA